GRVLITGASRGIGRALAVRLAGPGRTIVVQGRDRRALEETVRLVRGKGGIGEAIAARLDTAQGAADVLAALGKGPVEVLVNNAGVSRVAPVGELTLAQWEESLAVNVTAPFLLMKGLLPAMGRGSSIVNVLSAANKATFPGWGAYTMSKAALEGLARVVREEVRGRGIRVIDVYLAATATDLWERVPGEWNRAAMLRPEEAAEAIAYALERPGEVLVESITVGGIGGNL
ncbi:MAG: SDR family NAD(P)-dependent oxidoreductase, partial [candidate division Zixibacteria bacterium]|nr:SDR family NAD(P)-dependent oxidoreductase [candidate division Zixibacteria bacterium]